ncbi:MAG TPA: hypothetical protein VK607_10655 [Kofleriaceae bacterium]|nr:hypothetical protein [Kofleriaceae bacterium]
MSTIARAPARLVEEIAPDLIGTDEERIAALAPDHHDVVAVGRHVAHEAVAAMPGVGRSSDTADGLRGD